MNKNSQEVLKKLKNYRFFTFLGKMVFVRLFEFFSLKYASREKVAEFFFRKMIVNKFLNTRLKK
jgi:hypothetical protein